MQLMFAVVCACTTVLRPVSASIHSHSTIRKHPGYIRDPGFPLPNYAALYNQGYSAPMGRTLHPLQLRYWNEHYQYAPAKPYKYLTSRGLVTMVFGKRVSKTLRHAVSDGFAVGGRIIRVPLLGAEKVINGGSYIGSLGVDFSKRLIGDIESVIGKGWQAVKAVQLPGFYTVLYFVGGMISVVSEIEKTVWFITSAVRKTIAAAQAFGIYASLKLVSGMLGPIIRSVHLDCVRIRGRVIRVNKFLVDELETADGRVCGISELHAIKNVTVTRNDHSFLIVKVPYAIDHLKISFKAVNVTNFSGLLLENAPMEVHIKRTLVEGRVSFQAGTLIRFMTIRLKVTKFLGFKIKINQQHDRTNVMDIIEDIDSILADVVRKTVNKKLLKFNERISKAITGK